jgi:hypothetical protein
MGRRLGKMTMQSDDYRHLREAFTEMALQRPGSPDGARWLAVAQACLDLERQSGTHRGPRARAHIAGERRDI